MKEFKIIDFEPSNRRRDGLTVNISQELPFPEEFKPKFEYIYTVDFPPGAKGGNHKHPRVEVFYTSGDLTFVWLDKEGERKTFSMEPTNQRYKLFIVPPHLPHAVVNNTNETHTLIEFAEEEQHDVEKVDLI